MTRSAALEYAPKPPFRRRRSVVRALLLLIGLLAGSVAWQWGPAAWKQAQIAYWQRQCLNYVLPTGQDVYVERAPAAAVILDKETAAGRVPSVDSANPPLVTTSARCWERYCALTAASVGPQDGLIFLHARTSRRGKRWLLAVRITSHGSNTIGIDSTVVDVADPRNVHGSTAFLFHGVTFFGSELQPTTATIRGGEPDASNSSRFTCQVAVGDLIGTLSGVIDDDGSFDPELRMDDSPR